MKIGIFFDSQINSGGGISVSQTKLKHLFNALENEDDYTCFVTNENTYAYLKKKNKYNLINFKINFFLKVLFFLHKIDLIKKIFVFFKVDNPLEKQLKKNDIDLLFFISPSSFVKFCEFTPFVYSIWEMQHRSIPYFPEYRDPKYSQSNYRLREQSYKYASDRAFKIIVDTNTTKTDVQNAYNCSRKDLFEIQAFVPDLPSYYERNKGNHNYDRIFDKLKLPKKKILFYPAQFWPHKNHIYLIKSLELLVKNNIDDFILVFTGHDKGNKKYIRNEINKRNLGNHVFLYDYLSLEQIISLYKNSFALTMTSLVGRSSLPLREAFYFKLPVFYSGGILDKEYAIFVNELKLDNIDYLKKYLSKENHSIDFQKIINAKEFYHHTCGDEIIINNYKSIIKDYKFNLEFWKEDK